MKPVIILSLFCLIFFQNSFAQEIKSNHLTVFGKVKVFAKADKANVVFSIKGVGRSLKLAFDDAKLKMKNISNQFDSLGLDSENISTSFFQSSENFGDKAFLSSKKDYRAVMTVTVTTDSLQLLEPLILAISASKIERIINVSFELTNYFSLRKRGLEKAISKAKEKADLVTEKLGVSYGNILEVQEIQTPQPEVESRSLYQFRRASPFNAPLYRMTESESNTSFYSQEISFYTEVKIVFEIINDK